MKRMGFDKNLEGSHVRAGNITYAGIPALAEFGGATAALHHPNVLFAHWRTALPITLNRQAADFYFIAVVAIGAGNAAHFAFNAHVFDSQITRTAVGRAVAAGAPELAVLTAQNEAPLHHNRAVFGVVLEHLVRFATGACGIV